MNRCEKIEGDDQSRTVSNMAIRSTIFDELSEAVFIWDRNGKCTEVNRTACVMLGYKKEEMIGVYFHDYVYDQDRSRSVLNNDGGASGGFGPVSARVKRKDGTVFPAEIRQMLLTGGNVAAIVTDVTSQSITEEKFRNISRLYATLSGVNHAIVRTSDIQELFNAICEIAVDRGGFRTATVCILDENGRDLRLVSSRGADSSASPDRTFNITEPPVNSCLVADTIRTGKVKVSSNIESITCGNLSGMSAQVGPLSFAACVPIRKKGKVFGALLLGKDDVNVINGEEKLLLEELGEDVAFAIDAKETEAEKETAETGLEMSEERFRMVADFTHDWEYWVDPDGRYVYVSPSCERITGYNPREFADDPGLLVNLVFEEDKASVLRHFEEIRSRVPGSLDFRIVRRDGEIRWIGHVCQPVFDKSGKWLGTRASNRDITGRKVAEEAVRGNEERVRRIMEQMNDAVVIIDDRGRLEFVSRAIERITGYKPGDLTGRHFSSILFEGDREEGRREFDAILHSGESRTGLEFRLRRKDGLIAHCEVDGSAYRSAQLTGVMGVIRDVSGRKRAEEEYRLLEIRRKDLEHQLLRAQKLESLGTLAGGIAHDFNNLLGIIIGYSTLLRRRKPDDMQFQKALESIRTAAGRGASLVRQLLTLARRTQTVFSPVNLNDVVEEVMELLNETFPKAITISKNLRQDLPTVVADLSQVHQVFMNLSLNARDAMPTGGTLLIATSVADGDALKDRFPAAESRTYVVVQFADTGVGMSEETKHKIFDPFFTTKRPGKGTGLGLALVYSIVEGHQGMIDVQSEEGKGTVFNLYFPVDRSEDVEVIPAEDESQEPGGGKETILVIEDEEMLLDIMRNFLVPQGYIVMGARDGEEGIRLYSEYMNEIDLVVLDLGLPKMNGQEVVGRIKSIDPAARIVIASGYVDTETQKMLLNAGISRFIPKPYSLREVLDTVRKALDSVLQ